MKLPLLILSFVAVAYSSNRLELKLINRVLTRLLDEELQALADCAQEVIKCDTGKAYPDCLDSADTKFTVTADLGKYFILKIMNLELEGNMKLADTIFQGLSNFEIDNVETTVTVVPLGIEIKFRLKWENTIDFKSTYDFQNLVYTKNNARVPIIGDGDMNINIKKLYIDVLAHKLLGGDMDYLRITPTVETFHVDFNKLVIGSDLTEYATEKFNEDFINNKLNLDLLEKYVMDFFNNKLYPELLQRNLRAESAVLEKLGQCIYNNFPQ